MGAPDDNDSLQSTTDPAPPRCPPESFLAVTLDGTRPDAVTSPGFSVAGYEILAELGRGGMGVVYQARQVGLNRICALKMILAGGHAGDEDLVRFRTEAESLAALQHPNIVVVYDIGQHEGRPYFSMEFCPGGGLDRKLAGTPLDPREAAHLVHTLAAATHAAHSAHVVHRDLKPANVLLTADGTPKITDFGLAKKLGDAGQTRTGAIMGTPSYMAPEQAEAKKDIGPACDTYALGAILYECLTGRPPFRAATSLDTILQVVSEEPVPPTRLNPKVPRDLETVCLKCLRKAPEKRYATAEALAQDLERWLRGEPIQARAVGQAERLWSACRRNPALASATALAGLALALAAGVSVWFAVYQAQAANRLSAELDRSKAIQREAQEHAAVSALHRARTLFVEDKRGESLLWLARALDIVPTENPTLHEEIRRQAATFSEQLRIGGDEFRHEARVNQAVLSPDGRTLVTASADRTARLWDVTTLKPLHMFRGHREEVLTAGFRPDGRVVFTGSVDRTARLWDVTTGKELAVFSDHPRGVHRVHFSPDGKTLVTVSGLSFFGMPAEGRLWDAATGRPRGAPFHHQQTLLTVTFAADGQTVLSWGKDRTVRRWDVATGQALGEVKAFPDAADWRSSFRFSQNGRLLLVGKRDGTACLWDLEQGKPFGEPVRHGPSVRGVAFGKNDEQFGEPVRHGPSVRGVAFGKNDEQFVTANEGNVRIWETATGRESRHSVWMGGQDIAYYGRNPKFLYLREANGGERVYDASGPNLWVGWRIEDPMRDRAPVTNSARQLEAVVSGEKSVSLQDTSASDAPAEQFTLFAQVFSRQELDPRGTIRNLDEPAWQRKRRELEQHVRRAGTHGVVARVARDELYWARREAETAEAAEDWERAERYLSKLIEAEPTRQHFDRRALVRAAEGQFRLAASDFASGPPTTVRAPHEYYRIGLVCLATGDTVGYREACTKLREGHDQDSRSPYPAELLDLYLLSPAGAGEVARYLPALEKQVAEQPRNDDLLIRLAGVRFRAGLPTGLDRQLEDAARAEEAPKVWLLLALIHHGAGRLTEARQRLRQAAEWLDSGGGNYQLPDWAGRLEIQLLRREAEARLAGR